LTLLSHKILIYAILNKEYLKSNDMAQNNITQKELNTDSFSKSQYLFTLGLSQVSSKNFLEAIKSLQNSSTLFLQEKNYGLYLESQLLLLKIYAEMEHIEDTKATKNKLLRDSSIYEASIYYSRFNCVLSTYFIYQKNYIEAQDYLDKALLHNIHLQTDTKYLDTKYPDTEHQNDPDGLMQLKLDRSLIHYTSATLYLELKSYLDLKLELEKLDYSIQEAHQFLTLNRLAFHLEDKLSYENKIKEINNRLLLLKGMLCMKQKDYTLADSVLWECYKFSQQNEYPTKGCMSLYLLYLLSYNYFYKGNYEQSSIYAHLVKKSLDKEIFISLSKKVNNLIAKLIKAIKSDYDLVLNTDNKTLLERDKGSINVKNQFVLLDMLKLFMSSPGRIYTKESLVQKIWYQQYDPRVHDNKIYVTIKRLKELIEPDYKNPRYIFRNKVGYYINDKLNMLIK